MGSPVRRVDCFLASALVVLASIDIIGTTLLHARAVDKCAGQGASDTPTATNTTSSRLTQLLHTPPEYSLSMSTVDAWIVSVVRATLLLLFVLVVLCRASRGPKVTRGFSCIASVCFLVLCVKILARVVMAAEDPIASAPPCIEENSYWPVIIFSAAGTILETIAITYVTKKVSGDDERRKRASATKLGKESTHAAELASPLVGGSDAGAPAGQVVAGFGPPPHKKKKQLKALSSLRFLAAMHIVAYHFYQTTGNERWDLFAKWGGSQLTFFFLLSGFILAYQYGTRIHATRMRDFDGAGFWVKRFARLYPTYILSIVLISIILPSKDVTAKQVGVMLVCGQAWFAEFFENHINTPSWAVGAFLFLYWVFPPCVRLLKHAGNKCRLVCITWFWLISALGAVAAMGYNLSVYEPLNSLFLSAHAPTFLIGTALGLVFEESPTALNRFGLQYYGGAVALGAILAIQTLTGGILLDATAIPFLAAWASNGMLTPLFAILVWYASVGQDVVCSTVLELRPLVYLGKISFSLYIMQACIYQYTLDYFSKWDLQTPEPVLFIMALLVGSAVTWHLVEGPCARLLVATFDALRGRGCHRGAPRSGSRSGGLTYKGVNAATPTALGSGGGYVDEEAQREPGALPRDLTNPNCTITDHDLTEDRPPRHCCVVLLQCLAYYAILAFCVFAYMYISLVHVEWASWDNLIDATGSSVACVVVNAFKWLAVCGMPALVFTTVGHLVWCPWRRVPTPAVADMLAEEYLEGKLYVRIVTRGKNPNLVRDSATDAARVLASVLPRDKWVVECATDNHMDLQPRMDFPVTEVVVPAEYRCPRKAKFKARALHYAAVHGSEATDEDWVVHLDEETRFDAQTVRHILFHCGRQDRAVRAGRQQHPNIGQGVILYGTGDNENLVTTLADSIRVADDFGKFRFQYMLHEPLIGMHGSFVVARTSVERAFGFDHGLAGSITEDCYFALLARAGGCKFSWIDGFMYEQSPFSIWDFIMQRRRWYGGLWLVCKERDIPLIQRATLFFFTVTWALSFFVGLAMLLCMLVGSDVTPTFRVFLGLVASVSCWGYVLGFIRTFSLSDGVARYFLLFYLQLVLQPVFAVMEIWGVVYAIFSPPIGGFHVVQKETKARYGDAANLIGDSGIEHGAAQESKSGAETSDP